MNDSRVPRGTPTNAFFGSFMNFALWGVSNAAGGLGCVRQKGHLRTGWKPPQSVPAMAAETASHRKPTLMSQPHVPCSFNLSVNQSRVQRTDFTSDRLHRSGQKDRSTYTRQWKCEGPSVLLSRPILASLLHRFWWSLIFLQALDKVLASGSSS
jgi:hypothetical protein